MGELQKKIGEAGEKIVYTFFQQIGWHPMSPGIDLACEFPEKHQRREKNGTHGVDLMFSYICPIVPTFRRNILISIKNSNKEETKIQRSKIKEDLSDVANALRCFNRSPQLQGFLNEGGGATTHENLGLLIKIDKDPEGEKSFLGGLGPRSQIEIEGSSTVCFMENTRFDFVDTVIHHVQKNFKEFEYSFLIPYSPLNASAETKQSSSRILPIQSLIAGPLALRLDKRQKSPTADCELAIYSPDDFNIGRFKRLLSIAQTLSGSWVTATIIFPGYQEVRDGDLARTILASMADKTFAAKIKLESLDLRLRMS